MSTLLRVLLVEDNPGDADLVREHLPKSGAWVFEVEHVGRLGEAIALANTGTFDVALLDMGLPDSDRSGTVSTFHKQVRGLPTVVMTGDEGENTGLKAIRDGADDFVAKGQVTTPLLVRILVYARERHLRAAQLRATEDRLNFALQATGAAAWDLDALDQTILRSPNYDRIFGYDPMLPEWTYPMFLDHVEPEDRAAVDKTFRSAPSAQGDWSLECRIRRHGGETRWVTVTGRHHSDDAGQERVAGLIRDITVRKDAELALEKSQEDLRQSQKMEAVGLLAGGIAHDFNNLLTAILGYSELILASEAPALDEVRSDVEAIKHAGERASALTKQILAFSRKQALRPRVVSLGDIITGLEPLLRRTLGEDIELIHLDEPGQYPVEVDVAQLEQVIMNLAINARDAMLPGGQLTLETASVEFDEECSLARSGLPPGRYVLLRVSDTGEGMDRATRERIFEPFFTTKAHGAGTGMGLATVYGIVKQSRGDIGVYSEPGLGTTFRIYLPRSAKPPDSEVASPLPGAKTLGTETILVVEDEMLVRSLIEQILKTAGYTLVISSSADEALAAITQGEQSIDLLLTDVVLPGAKQGHDLARAAVEARPDLPVLFMSGYTRNALVHAGRLDEGVDLIEKPFTPDALAVAVRSVLDRPRATK